MTAKAINYVTSRIANLVSIIRSAVKQSETITAEVIEDIKLMVAATGMTVERAESCELAAQRDALMAEIKEFIGQRMAYLQKMVVKDKTLLSQIRRSHDWQYGTDGRGSLTFGCFTLKEKEAKPNSDFTISPTGTYNVLKSVFINWYLRDAKDALGALESAEVVKLIHEEKARQAEASADLREKADERRRTENGEFAKLRDNASDELEIFYNKCRTACRFANELEDADPEAAKEAIIQATAMQVAVIEFLDKYFVNKEAAQDEEQAA